MSCLQVSTVFYVAASEKYILHEERNKQVLCRMMNTLSHIVYTHRDKPKFGGPGRKHVPCM